MRKQMRSKVNFDLSSKYNRNMPFQQLGAVYLTAIAKPTRSHTRNRFFILTGDYIRKAGGFGHKYCIL